MIFRKLLIGSILLVLTLASYAEQDIFYLEKKSLTSHKRFYRVLPSKVPFDKDYSDLSLDQQLEVKKYYPDIAEGDQPPYPVGGMRSLYTILLDAQLDRKSKNTRSSVATKYHKFRRGNLKLTANVSALGEVSEVTVLESPSNNIGRRMIEALSEVKFNPAIVDGRPVAASFRMQISSYKDIHKGYYNFKIPETWD